MGIPEQDRNKLSGDRRFSRLLQTAQAIPDTMTVRGTALTIVLERINAPQGSMTITGAVAGGEITLNEVSVNSLRQPFTANIQGTSRVFVLIPQKQYDDGKVPVRDPVWVVSQIVWQSMERELTLDKRVDSLTDLVSNKNFDPRPFVSDDYRVMALSLEESLTYLRTGVGLHKQAVQNAVDIVQSKRLAFFESGEEPNWTGILFMIGFVFFIELAAVPLAAAMIGTLISGLARVSPTAARAVLGPAKAKEVETAVASLKLSKKYLKEIKLERDAGPGFYDQRLIKVAYEQYKEVIQDIRGLVKDSQKNLDIKLSEVHRHVAELIKSGEGKEHLSGLAKVLGKDNVKTNAKVFKEIAGGYSGKKDKKRPRQHVSVDLPLDVVLKMNIQSIFDNDLWFAERLYLEVNQVSKLALVANPNNQEHRALLKEAIRNGPRLHRRIMELEQSVSSLQEPFENIGMENLNKELTKTYELKIWILLYATRYSAHRKLVIQGVENGVTGIGFYKSPVTPEERGQLSQNLNLKEVWRDVTREEYEKLMNDGYVVEVFERGDANKRKTLFNYLKARFDWEGDGSDKVIATQLADMHAALHGGQKKSGLTPEELLATSVTWTRTRPAPERE